MKRKILAAILFSPLFTLAQSYTFSVRQEPYQKLQNKTLLSSPGVLRFLGKTSFHMQIPFYAFNEQMDSIVMYSKGAVVLYHRSSPTIIGVSSCAAETGERYTNTPRLYASYMDMKIDTVNGKRILKLEYDNVGFAYPNGHDSSNFFNAQIWFYEGSNIIEYRYGPHFIDAPVWMQGYTGLYASLDSADNSALYNITGNPSSPVISTNNDLNLTEFPDDGTVYRFTPTWGFNTAVKEVDEVAAFNIYPNPAHDDVTIQLKQINSPIAKVIVTDLHGKEISAIFPGTGSFSFQFSVKELPAGIYFIRTETTAGSSVRKLLVQ